MAAEDRARTRRLSIPTRIFLAFALTLAAFASVAVTSLVQHDRTARQLRLLHDGYLPLAMRFNEARAQQSVFRQQLERVLDSSRLGRAWFDAARQVRPGTRRRFQHYFNRADRLARQAGDLETLESAGQSFESVLALYERTQPGYDRLFTALDNGQDEVAAEELNTLLQDERAISREYREGYNRLVDRIDAIAAESADQERQASIVLGVLALLALGVGLTATIWSQRVLRPLPLLQERVAAVAEGDLSSRKLQPRGDDELAHLAQDFERMVEALAARDARLEDLRRMQAQIVAGLRAAVVVLDDQDRVRTLNPAARTVLGLSEASVGEELASVLSLPVLLERLGDARGRSDGIFLEATSFEGRSIDLLATPLGSEKEVLLVAEDVTDALRTKDRLIQTERLAAIGRMAAHVTHEVRNPLSSIGLNVEMLEDELAEGDNEARALMRAIHREVDRLTAITEEYLRLARLPQPHLEPDELSEMLESVALFVRREMETSNVELVLDVARDLPMVAYDEAQMRQALLNLLRNAREAMEGGVIRIVARARGEGVQLDVIDEGPGIAEDQRHRIFDLFFSTKERGSGLGLPLTKQIVAAHGGTIACLAAEGGGTRFELWLPAAGAVAAE
ncbi:MAG: ATP-binding protein [Myxococcota bacterium]